MTKKKAREWAKEGVVLKLVALIAPLTVLFVTLLCLGFYAFWMIQGDGTGINYAGQTRYRSYELALLINEYPALQGGARDKARGTILELTKGFENILYGLRDGNEALGLKGFKAPKEGGVFSYTDPWWQYDRHIKDYNERIRPLITHILESTGPEEAKASLKIYNKEVPAFVTDVNRTVHLLTSLSEKKVLRFKNVEFILLGLFLGTIGIAVFLVRDFNRMSRALKSKVAEVQTTHDLLNEVLGGIGCLVRIVDPKAHRVTFQSKSLQAIYPDGLKRHCYTLLGSETPCERCTSAEAIEKKKDFCKEEEAANGGVFYEIHSFPFPNPDGSITTAIEVIRDITARKKAEWEIQTSQNLVNEVLGSIGCFVRIVNPRTHKVIFQNRPLEAVYPEGLKRHCYTLLGSETPCERCTSAE
ncbi:MAG TPA: type IV pili methyl-accepting chemotaxis transducer N-terminal domain-containing protein, partial [Candidatus Brocadiales bacterium]|nr:type IV pili methyl-accepting chemotaxis transducer N-terminal domain-containing protein [Candidatus Brocadiales bacterium]